jgi:hypothetical protein
MIEYQLDGRPPAGKGHADARHDDAQCEVVERGISMQQSSNTMTAVEFLKSHDVRPQVIARVLLEPEKRRNRDD